MKRKIPECEHGNEYDFEGFSLVLSNGSGSNKIYLSRQDFKKLIELAPEGFT